MAAITDINIILRYLTNPATDLTTNIYMITRKKENNDFFYNIFTAETHDDIAIQLNNIFTDHLKHIFEKNKDFREYDIDDSTNEYLQYIPQSSVSAANDIFTKIINNDADPFAINTEMFNNLWTYAVKIELDDNNKVVWFRKYNKSMVFKKGNLDAMFFKDGKFSKIEHDVFKVDNKVDCFIWNDEIYISQHNNFEKIFSYEDQYEAKSSEALQMIKETFSYIDHDSLKIYVEKDSSQKRKLAAILKNGVYGKYGFNEVTATIEKYGLDIEVNTNEQKLNLTPKDSRRFLKILNDDYLRSEVTKIRYESIAKRKGQR